MGPVDDGLASVLPPVSSADECRRCRAARLKPGAARTSVGGEYESAVIDVVDGGEASLLRAQIGVAAFGDSAPGHFLVWLARAKTFS